MAMFTAINPNPHHSSHSTLDNFDNTSKTTSSLKSELLTDIIDRYPENDYEDVNVTADRMAVVHTVDIASIIVDERGESLIMTDAMIDGNNDREYIEALVEDLKNGEGFTDPIVVFAGDDGRYIWSDGQHRVTAAHKAGRKTIEAIVILP